MGELSHPTALSRRLVYQSPWVNLYVDRVQFPNGVIIDQHHLLDFDHQAVMAIPVGEDGRFLMVKVARYPTGSAGWEFPAGSVEAGEDILQAAQREVLEETGYGSCEHRMLYSYYPMNGIANQMFHISVCKATHPERDFDASEITSVGWFSADEIWRMIREQEMLDGYALLAFLLEQSLGKASWGEEGL